MTVLDSATRGSEALDWVVHALGRFAAVAGLQVRPAPELASGSFQGGQGSASAELAARDLPSMVHALRLGRYAVLVGLLPETARQEEIVETLRRFRNQCVVARSHLLTNEALDLQLVLVGPRGSESNDPWHWLALMVERDERVARKLVWLRPADPGLNDASFMDFTRRTFMAHPWEHQGVFSMAPLDNLSHLETAGEVPHTMAEEWSRLAIEHQADPVALVEGLVSTWARRSAA